jgi:hypothetical protein
LGNIRKARSSALALDTVLPVEHAERMRTTRLLGGLLAICLAGFVLIAGCHKLTGEPTRQIRTPEPPTTFVSTAGGYVAHASFDEPAVEERFSVKPIEAWTEQETAADALGRIGPPAVPALVEALKSPEAEVRLKAIEVLARMGNDAKDATPDLIRLLDDPDERIRKAATRALGIIGPEAAPAVPALMRSLMQPDPLPPSGELKPVPPQ